MLTVADRSVQKAQDLISEEIDRLTEIVVQSTAAVSDFAIYRHYAGQIIGLNKALDSIKEGQRLAQQEASGRTTTQETR